MNVMKLSFATATPSPRRGEGWGEGGRNDVVLASWKCLRLLHLCFSSRRCSNNEEPGNPLLRESLFFERQPLLEPRVGCRRLPQSGEHRHKRNRRQSDRWEIVSEISIRLDGDLASETKAFAPRPSDCGAVASRRRCLPSSAEPPHPDPLPCGERENIVLFARPHAEQMADRVNEIGAVHGVEVKVGHAVIG